MLLMIDNYDSFTYNLVQYFGELGEDVRVFRNDQITVEQIAELAPDRIVISPGPCTPNEAGVSVETILHFGGVIPILGVCLGHQSIGQAYGGNIVRAKYIMHGKTSQIHHAGQGVFAGLPSPFEATRYHSLVIERESLPDCLVCNPAAGPGASALTREGLINAADDDDDDALPLGFGEKPPKLLDQMRASHYTQLQLSPTSS